MAILDVVVPQLSESVAEATLLQWHKKVGEAIARDENLIDIETDKVVLELPAPAQGVLIEIVKGDGSSVVAGELIARIDTEATASASAAAPTASPTAAPAAAPVATAAASAPASTSASSIAMPAAAKMLAENNMSANAVAGTGKDGRVTKGDVIGALESKASGASSVASSAAPAVRTVNALPAVAVPTNLDLVKLF
jgi:2-oxoglutarate dehydrogenase E2 component (dihydrolipoamide succinyltransferase)